MTNREYLQRQVRRWIFPVVPVLIGGVWIRYFGSSPGHVEYFRDDLALLTGGVLMGALSYCQLRLFRARFRCPRCSASVWDLQGNLTAAPLKCPHCALDMDAPYEEHRTPG